VEVASLHAPLLHRDLALERRREAEAQRAFHLLADEPGVDRRAAVDRAHDAVDADGLVDRTETSATSAPMEPKL